MELSPVSSPKSKRLRPNPSGTPEAAAATRSLGQVFLKRLQIEGFKTFCESESVDMCPGWTPCGEVGSPAPSPLTVVFGGNGAGKSSVFDAVFFVLGQSAKSIRSSGGSAQLVNDQSVFKNGANASASVTITFQKGGGSRDMDTDSGDDQSDDCKWTSHPKASVRELTVGRSVKHARGTSTYSVQGNTCSRTTMMQKLNSFVGADMGDVDRYVLKQGSTMVCRRDGKELLEFIERLAGTANLKTETDKVQTVLDDLREEALGLETDIDASLQARKQLQPQVDAFFTYRKDAAELRREKTGLWHRKLALLRVRLVGLEATVVKNEEESADLRSKIKSSKARSERAESDLARANQVSGKAFKTLSAAHGRLQKAKSAQAEDEVLAKKSLKNARSNKQALARACKLLEEGAAETAELSAQASRLESTSASTAARIAELESAPEFNLPGGAGDEDGLAKREDLLRELSALEDGPLPELEKAITERKNISTQANQLLDRLGSDLGAARLELERRDEAAVSSQEQLKALRARNEEVHVELAELRAHCASQQALVGGLEARRASKAPLPSAQHRQAGTAGGQPGPGGRVGALRLLLARLRDCGVGAYGLLADLVLLRRQGDETAVAAVLGSTLRNTVVVRTRADGARVVAEVRRAGIPGQVRCDVLDEIKRRGEPATPAGKREGGGGGGGGGGLSALSECVTTADPHHLPAAQKHLHGWLLAETRQVAWGSRSGPSKSGAANIVTALGELFYASGEVAVKAPHESGSSEAPRLGLVQSVGRQQQPGAQRQRLQQQQEQMGAEDGAHAVEARLMGALKALSAAEARMAELTREATQARFECEDAQVRLSTAQTKAKECRREMFRIEQKVSAQRRLVDDSIKHGSPGEDADEIQLAELRQRRDRIVADLAEKEQDEGIGPPERAGQPDVGGARVAAYRELRELRAKAEAELELRDEIGLKLRVLAKRGKARRDRVEALTAEKKGLETQQEAVKARQLLHDENISNLLSGIEEIEAVSRATREAARAAEVAARKARRELIAAQAARAELRTRQKLVSADYRKAQTDSSRVMQFLADAAAAGSDSAEDETAEQEELVDSDTDDSETMASSSAQSAAAAAAAAAAEAAAAARLARELENFLRRPTRNGAGGGSVDNSNNNVPERRSAEDGAEDDDLEVNSGERGSEGQGAAAAAAAATVTAKPSTCGKEDEAAVATFVKLLKAGGEETEFSKETGIAEASIWLKEASLKKRREAVDEVSLARAVRLDGVSVRLARELKKARESVVVLMDKKEMLEATRHATLVECLEEVNEALKGIYRRLTSVEDSQGYKVMASGGKFGVRGVPGGDCFLRFSRERTLLLSEGLAVQVKPEPSSPWRGPGSLSGGQVALVGLALNLATQAVRPAPLYLMDEIDSALDTHKVARVAAMLADRTRGGNEQCIVISHRPEMHERGSHLIGVYHCEGTARTVGLELVSQLPPAPDDEESGSSQSSPP